MQSSSAFLFSTIRYCDQIIRNRTHTVLPPSDHPDHHQYGAHSGLSRLAWWKGSRGDVGLRVRRIHMTSRMVADGHFQFDLMLQQIARTSVSGPPSEI